MAIAVRPGSRGRARAPDRTCAVRALPAIPRGLAARRPRGPDARRRGSRMRDQRGSDASAPVAGARRARGEAPRDPGRRCIEEGICNMTVDDEQNDPTLAALSSLRTRDVSPRHAHRLRRRCHALLQAQSGPKRSTTTMRGTAFQRIIAPAIAGAWCLAYLIEIVRRTAAVYFGAQ